MKKTFVLVLGALVLVMIFGNALVSGVCCEKLKSNGLLCQSASSVSECDSEGGIYNSWEYKETCESVPECHVTCIDGTTGECSENNDKTACTLSEGTPVEAAPEDIPACQEVCCIIGQEAYFVNPTRCHNMFEQYGVEGTIDTSITTRSACEAMRHNTQVGACVISTINKNTCKILTGDECQQDNLGELSQYLQDTGGDDIEVYFYEGRLCTARANDGTFISSCAKSTSTECKDGKVYYKDTCGNLANIYDASKYNNNDYWTYIKDPYYDEDVCTVSASGSNTCGNCDPTTNTVCKNYQEVDGMNKPNNNDQGLVCGDLSCKYTDPVTHATTTYENGESWCVGNDKSAMIISRNLTTSVIFKSNITALEDASKYNLPGSRYYKMICSAGDITVEECGDYRKSVCIQGRDDTSKKIEAACVFNPGTNCLNIYSKTECEDNTSLCKWIPGYRTDFKVVPEEDRKELQGTCAPLIAPGFDFWTGKSVGNVVCAIGNAQEYTLFETPIMFSRNKLTGTSSDAWPLKFMAERCVSGCYAIPEYGKEFNQISRDGVVEEKKYPEDIDCGPGVPGCTLYNILTEFYDESEFKLPENVKSYHLSLRRGQYCHKDGKPDQLLTGKVTGRSYDCTPGAGSEAKDERKERDYPIYLTNDEWIRGLMERAVSLGDCGYKAGMNGDYSDPESEMVTAIFQKLKQNGDVKKNVTVEQIIWKGGKYITGDLEKYETTLATSTISSSCSDYNGICTLGACDEDYGGVEQAPAEGETLCASSNMICCVYPESGETG